MRGLFLVLASALLGSGCILQPTEAADCAIAAGCTTCLANPGCGWCGSSGQCVPGASFGPDEADCVLSSWRFTGCSEPPAVTGCGRRDTCNSCLFDLDDNPECTWCAGRSECIGLDEECPSGFAVREYDSCSLADCAAQSTCDGCLRANCDWCDVGGGNCSSNGSSCDAHYRFWTSGDRCPPANGCDGHFDCSSCLADPACGWCDSPGAGGHCQASDGFGDFADWCSSGDFHTSFCP